MLSIIFYLLIGIIAGLLAGLLGIGGGIIIVPSLSWVLAEWGHTTNASAMHYAIASSIACIVLTTLVSAWSHKKQNHVAWFVLRSLLPGLLIGSVAGAYVAHLVSTDWLQLVFAVFALLIAIHLILPGRKSSKKSSTGYWPHYSISFLIGLGSGFIASLIGLGGGVILVPIFLLFNIPAKKAVGTSAVCTLVVSITALLTYLLLPTEHILPQDQLNKSTGYVYWPAVFVIAIMSMIFAHIGAKLSKVLSTIWLTRAFALLLVLISIHMFFSAWFS